MPIASRGIYPVVMERGLHPDEFVGRFSFNFDIHGNLFEQVGKFRPPGGCGRGF